MTTISQIPQLSDALDGLLDARFPARFHDGLDFNRVRGVDDTEDVFAGDEAEAGVGGLQVVDCLAHVAFGAKDEGGDAVVGILDVFGLADL